MIPQIVCTPGEGIRLSGYAIDFGKAIAAIDFSLDGMAHWTRYDTPGADDIRRVNWQFVLPAPAEPGAYTLFIRSVNDRGEVSPTPDSAELLVQPADCNPRINQ